MFEAYAVIIFLNARTINDFFFTSNLGINIFVYSCAVQIWNPFWISFKFVLVIYSCNISCYFLQHGLYLPDVIGFPFVDPCFVITHKPNRVLGVLHYIVWPCEMRLLSCQNAFIARNSITIQKAESFLIII